MRKFLTITLSVLSILLLSVGLGGCFGSSGPPEEPHVHEFIYWADAEKHYQECRCGEKSENSAHSFNNGMCVCGYNQDNVFNFKDGVILGYKPEFEPLGRHLYIPESINGEPVLEIGEHAFSNYLRILTVTFAKDSKVKKVGNFAFNFCDSMVSLSLPASLTEITGLSFLYKRSLTSITIDENNPKYHVDGNCVIETATNTLVFGCNSSVIPNYVTKIGDRAFSESNIKRVEIPEGVTEMEYGVFRVCEQLESVKFAKNCKITDIKTETFEACYKLTDVQIPKGVTHLGQFAFSWCRELKSVTIPKGLTEIEEWAFNYCQNLTDIKVEDGNPVFHSDKNCIIETATNVLVVGSASGEIPSYVTEIGREAFNGRPFNKLFIPKNVVKIGYSSFSDCTKMETVEFEEGTKLEFIDVHAFSDCESLKEITIPKGVKSIEYGVFSGCRQMEKVVFPIGVSLDKIDGFAFKNCYRLKNFIIHKTVKYIGLNAFKECREIDMFFYEGTAEMWNQIEKDASDEKLMETTKCYYAYDKSEVLSDNNTYWHYDKDNSPVIWEN
jgi:hypothetical protein